MSAALREHLRTPVSFIATVTRRNGDILTGELTSASLGGAFILCDKAHLKMGENCNVSIILSDGQSSIDGQAIISYLKPDGIGVRFEGVDPGSYEHLVRLMMYHVHYPEAIHEEVIRTKGKRS